MHVEVVAVALERGAVEIRNLTNGFADLARGFVHRVRLSKAFAGIEAGAEQIHHRLAEREAAARQDDEDALIRLDERVHFARHVEIVESGVGARIGRHDQTFVCHDA